MDTQTIYDSVQEHYSTIAKRSEQDNTERIAKHFGYDAEDMDSIISEANLGLSCGNPLAIASMKPGETVVDLGCGAGFDVFQAAKKVAEHGKAIGIDQNDDMLARAYKNRDKAKVDNVVFVKSPITAIDLPDASADCIISNCVINLVPEFDKPTVFKEMFRLLKPGGRVAVSDILAKKPMPESIQRDIALYVGCIAGASQVEQYNQYLHDAGFIGVTITDTQKSVNVYKDPGSGCQSCCDTPAAESSHSADIDFDEWAGSFKIFALKPEE